MTLPSKREFVEWRAVGVDLDEFGNGYPVAEPGAWHREREAAEADAEELRASAVPFDEVYVERRVMTERIERVAH